VEMKIGMVMMMMLEVGMLGDLLTSTFGSCTSVLFYWLFLLFVLCCGV
jgi:hypothetical protein